MEEDHSFAPAEGAGLSFQGREGGKEGGKEGEREGRLGLVPGAVALFACGVFLYMVDDE